MNLNGCVFFLKRPADLKSRILVVPGCSEMTKKDLGQSNHSVRSQVVSKSKKYDFLLVSHCISIRKSYRKSWIFMTFSTLRRPSSSQSDSIDLNPFLSFQNILELQESGVLGPQVASEKNRKHLSSQTPPPETGSQITIFM